jgi:hypothetical protein
MSNMQRNSVTRIFTSGLFHELSSTRAQLITFFKNLGRYLQLHDTRWHMGKMFGRHFLLIVVFILHTKCVI